MIDFFDLYRELDRGTMYFRNHLNQTVLKGVAINKDNIDEALVSKVLLKSIVYRLINKVETFMDFGGIPDLETFDEFLGFIRYCSQVTFAIFKRCFFLLGIIMWYLESLLQIQCL